MKENKEVMAQPPLTFEDLDGCLAYAPWAIRDEDKGDDPVARYISAIEMEVVPPLSPFNEKSIPALVKLFEMKKWLPDRANTEDSTKIAVEHYLQLEAWPDMYYVKFTERDLAKIGINPKKIKGGLVIQEIGWRLPSQLIE